MCVELTSTWKHFRIRTIIYTRTNLIYPNISDQICESNRNGDSNTLVNVDTRILSRSERHIDPLHISTFEIVALQETPGGVARSPQGLHTSISPTPNIQ